MPRKTITFADMLTVPKRRWPAQGDRLFEPAVSGAPEAEIHRDSFTRSVFMIDGYKRAADILVDEAETDHIARGELVYPIIFSYRQFLELSLKWQISTYGSICGIPKPKNGHKLKELFEDFSKICKIYGATDDAALDAVGECILEFDRMDSHSFTFRYSANDKGLPYPVTTDRIDLARLKDVMDGIHGFFRGCDGYFNAAGQAEPDDSEYSGF
jgi:hypothetical protein